MKQFTEKRIVITGAGSGLGRAIALEFAAMNWRICVSDISLVRADETTSMANEAGGRAFSHLCDVTKPDQVEAMAAMVKEKWGGVDILVNNAGVAAAGFMEEIPLETWDWIIDINLKSVVYGCRAFIPMLRKQNKGHIVNVASNAGITSLPEMSCYNVTKAGVISLSETLRAELRPSNIGVSVVAPTFFKTNLMDQFTSPSDRQKKMADAFFKKSRTTSEDVARHVVKAVRKNKLYVITQLDGKFSWFTKRMTPEIYYNVLGWGYSKGALDKYLGI